MRAYWKKYRFIFKRPATTSRGVLLDKTSYFIALQAANGAWGLGECSLLPELSIDDHPDFVPQLDTVCERLNRGEVVSETHLHDFPALRFGLEMARLGEQAANGVAFSSPFTQGQSSLPINGLIWMADKRDMQAQIRHKLTQGFHCIKLKIGALDFAAEYALLRALRREYSAADLEIRVDANGAFAPAEAMDKLHQLAALQLHSIEQPIAPGQIAQMAALAAQTPLPIALDEELIGVQDAKERAQLLDVIRPQYVILKPSLLGGFAQAQQWIDLAHARGIGWWVTSALESNLGLNLLAQWTATLNNPLPQGLGTGLLYTNNLPSPLSISAGYLHFDPDFDNRQYSDIFQP